MPLARLRDPAFANGPDPMSVFRFTSNPITGTLVLDSLT
jgi:hypothetical protein